MITAKELAEKLNGRAYGDSFDDVKKEAVWIRREKNVQTG